MIIIKKLKSILLRNLKSKSGDEMGRNQSKFLSLVIIAFMLLQNVIPLMAVTVPVGTLVQLELGNTISSANAHVGQKINFTVLNDILVENKVAIKSGSKAVGKIISVDDSGMVGKPGGMSIQLTRVTAVDGSIIPISANSVLKGEDKTGTAVVITLVLCIFGLFIEGGDAMLQAGSIIEADIIGEVDVDTDNPIEITETLPEVKDLKQGDRLEITTTRGKLLIGNLESKKDGVISIFDLETLYRIKSDKISSAVDNSGKNVTTQLMNLTDFKTNTKYKWNRISVERIN